MSYRDILFSTSIWSYKKQENSRKISTSASLTMLKPLTVWITINWKILKEMGISDHLICLLRNLYAGQEATIRTGHANPWTAACQASLSITNSQTCSDSCPSSWWCHSTISSSVVPFSCLQSFLASGSFPMSQLFVTGGQSILAKEFQLQHPSFQRIFRVDFL